MENETEEKKPEAKKSDRAELIKKLKQQKRTNNTILNALVVGSIVVMAGIGKLWLNLQESWEKRANAPTPEMIKRSEQRKQAEGVLNKEEPTYTAWADSVSKQYTKADEAYADSVAEEYVKKVRDEVKEKVLKERVLNRAKEENPEMAEKGKQVDNARKTLDRINKKEGGAYR